ncbi:MAG: hypothetical protein ABWK04_00395 [Hydrogenobacter sp.]|uniref:hypothetical protein n=1 Tax=Hydrogenobacter thermophilus TaxID=940 RepID=UPI0030F72A2B
MRWISFVLLLLLGMSFIEPIYEQAYAKSHHKKVYLQKKKAKRKVKSKVVVKPSKNVNAPQEGELLKLEGMVKDLNEQ